MSNFNALQIREVTYKVSKEVYKISRILALVTVSLVSLVVTLVKLWVDHEVEEALVKELAPAKEQKLLMPSKELAPVVSKVKVLVQDLEDLNLEELQCIARIEKIKGWNFCKEETLRAKLANM